MSQKRVIEKNVFDGINPLLNEMLLELSLWQEFHNLYLSDILKALRVDLLKKGYVVYLEESVQVRRIAQTDVYRPDLLISRPPDSSSGKSAVMQIPSTATEILEIPEAIQFEQETILAVVIRKRENNEPITWIELLSPTNKLPNQAFYDYQIKRDNIIKSGICFIEIDFIHTQPPTFRNVVPYADGGYPFHVTIVIPRPTVRQGKVLMYHFGIAENIPTIAIPLEDEDSHVFDMNEVYQKTFREASYGLELDYTLTDLHNYAEQDRLYILKRIVKALDDSPDSTST